MASSAQWPREAQPPAWEAPPNLPAGCMLTAQQPLSLPQGGCISSLVTLLCCQFFHLELVCQIFVCLDQGVSILSVQQTLSPRPLSWQPTLSKPPGFLCLCPKSWCHRHGCLWCQRLFRCQICSREALPMSTSSPASSSSLLISSATCLCSSNICTQS